MNSDHVCISIFQHMDFFLIVEPVCFHNFVLAVIHI